MCDEFTYASNSISGGDIKIYRKDGSRSFELIGEAKDPNPIEIKYISFDSSQTDHSQLYFNCSFSVARIDDDGVFAVTEHPLLAKFNVPPSVDLRNCKMGKFVSFIQNYSFLFVEIFLVLVTNCNHYTNWEYEYEKFIKISDIVDSQPDGYIARIAVFIQAGRDAHIGFTLKDSNKNPDEEIFYEYGNVFTALTNSNKMLTLYVHFSSKNEAIGIDHNAAIEIRKNSDRKFRKSIKSVRVKDALNPKRPMKMVLEISSSGHLRLYWEKMKSTPIVSAFDENVLPVQYVSFASTLASEAQYFYNCTLDW